MINYSTGCINQLLGTANFKTLFTDCVVKVFSGAQPADADASATGTYLGSITLGGNAFVAGAPTNGLSFDAPVGKTMAKAVAEDWKLKYSAAGTAGYCRLCANALDNDLASVTLPRIDMSIGITSGDVKVSTVTGVLNALTTIDTFVVDWS